MNNKTYWITWEDHRRSRELAAAFEAKYVALLHKGERHVRYPILAVRTLIFLVKNRPKILFCQNPSIVLSALLVLLKPIFRYTLIMDRHSNFKFPTLSSNKIKWRIFHALSGYVNSKADVTIVTNDHLKNIVEKMGGSGFVLQDKLPDLSNASLRRLKGKFNVVFVSTFSEDEPILQVFDAADQLGDEFSIYVTGNYKKYSPVVSGQLVPPSNVELTGFLSEADYRALLNSVDLVMVITDMEYTLTCGAYEAVSLEKPMLLADTTTIRSYFYKGAVYTRPVAHEIAENIREAKNSIERLKGEVQELKPELLIDWQKRFEHFKHIHLSPPNRA